MSFLDSALTTVRAVEPRAVRGSVHALRGLTLVVDRLRSPIGSLVAVDVDSAEASLGEVIGFDGPRSLVMLYGSTAGVAPGTRVRALRTAPTVSVGRSWLGRTLDALGRPTDGGPAFDELESRPLDPPAVNPMARSIIREPLPTGIRAIDAFLTVGKGQRLGIFAGPGVGKSNLLANIAKGTAADIAVIGLIGERRREVKEFVEQTLGPEGLKRGVVIAATGDESPLLRVRAASVAIAAAEHFRDLGLDVVLMLDSITRLAQAQRQIGLAVGEQPATKGYTPSVFALLPRLLERAGAIDGSGSITGFYTVLVEGDDLTEPVADAARGILDGHVVLSRRLASNGHYPAIDILESISRVADQVSDPNHRDARRECRRLLATHRENEDLITIGAYQRGASAEVDAAIELKRPLDEFLRQGIDESSDYPRTLRRLIELSVTASALVRRAPAAQRSANPPQAAPPRGR